MNFILAVAEARDELTPFLLPSISELEEIIQSCQYDDKLTEVTFYNIMQFWVACLENRFVTSIYSTTEVDTFVKSADRLNAQWEKVEKGYERFPKDLEWRLTKYEKELRLELNSEKAQLQNIVKSSSVNTHGYRSRLSSVEDRLNNTSSSIEKEKNRLLEDFENKKELDTLASPSFHLPSLKELDDNFILPTSPILEGDIDAEYYDLAISIKGMLCRSSLTDNSTIDPVFKKYWTTLCLISGYKSQSDSVAKELMEYIKIDDFWTQKHYSALSKEELTNTPDLPIQDLYNELVNHGCIEPNKKEEFTSIFTGYYYNNEFPSVRWLLKSRTSKIEGEQVNFYNLEPLLYLVSCLRSYEHYYAYLEFSEISWAAKKDKNKRLDLEEAKKPKVELLVRKPTKAGDSFFNIDVILGDKDLLLKCFKDGDGLNFDKKKIKPRGVATEVTSKMILSIVEPILKKYSYKELQYSRTGRLCIENSVELKEITEVIEG